MSYNGSGTFLINTAGQPVVSGTVISSTAFNALTADLATGLSTAITKDGQTTVTANIPMGTYKFTGLGAGTAATDSANLSQVQSTVTKLLASVSGADTITAVGSPTLGAYAAGQMFYFIAAGDNTGAVTLNIDSLGAKAVTRDGSVALAAGDIKSGEVVVVVYDGTRFQVVSQINSSGNATFANVSITSALNVGGVATFSAGTAAAPSITTSGDTNNGIFFPATDVTAITTAGSERLRVDASGNLGLGGTPSGWVDVKALEIGSAGSHIAGYSAAAIPNVYVGTNCFFDGSNWKYKVSGYSALRYIQNSSNEHAWFNSASGTAGNTITFTQAMTLDASGNLGVGTTSPGQKLVVAGNIVGDSWIGRSNISAPSADAAIYRAADNTLAFSTASTERARITSDGDFLIGKTAIANNGGIGFVSNVSSLGFGRISLNSGYNAAANSITFAYSGTEVGYIQQTTTAVTYNSTSDRRLKENIAPSDAAGAIIDAIEIVKHDWKVGGHTRYGVIAQDLHKVTPEAVAVGDDGDVVEQVWGVDYSKLVPMLVKEIQSLRARVAQLEAK